MEKNIKQLFNDHCEHDQDNDPPEFNPEIRFNNTVVFNSKDNIIEEAEPSLNQFSDSPSHPKSWASIVAGTTNTATSTITHSVNNDISEIVSKLNDTINSICSRLEKIESALNEQAQGIERAAKFEIESSNSMKRLGEILWKLENRTRNQIKPRQLEDSYDSYVPNKRQDTRGTPTKSPRTRT